MTERTILIAPYVRLVTEEEISALRARQSAVAIAMGERWILHCVHSPKSKKQLLEVPK